MADIDPQQLFRDLHGENDAGFPAIHVLPRYTPVRTTARDAKSRIGNPEC